MPAVPVFLASRFFFSLVYTWCGRFLRWMKMSWVDLCTKSTLHMCQFTVWEVFLMENIFMLCCFRSFWLVDQNTSPPGCFSLIHPGLDGKIRRLWMKTWWWIQSFYQHIHLSDKPSSLSHLLLLWKPDPSERPRHSYAPVAGQHVKNNFDGVSRLNFKRTKISLLTLEEMLLGRPFFWRAWHCCWDFAVSLGEISSFLIHKKELGSKLPCLRKMRQVWDCLLRT